MFRKWLFIIMVALAAGTFAYFASGCGAVSSPPTNFLPRIGF